MDEGPSAQPERVFTRLRIEAGYSARQLAEAAGISLSSVLRAERGKALAAPIRGRLVGVLGPRVLECVPEAGAPGPDATPVRMARHRLGLSRAEAARRARVSADVLARAERGQGVYPQNARRIALAFGLAVTDVLPVPDDNDHEAAA